VPYEVIFPSERVEPSFEKALRKIPAHYQAAIAGAIRSLQATPWPKGKRFKKLTDQVVVSAFIAHYRLRVGLYRVLYDVDIERRKVIILKLLKRDEHTYRW